jgi:hypothetical protein
MSVTRKMGKHSKRERERSGATDDIDVLGTNIKTKIKNTEAILHSSYEVELEVNTEKCKYMLISLSRMQKEEEKKKKKGA